MQATRRTKLRFEGHQIKDTKDSVQAKRETQPHHEHNLYVGKEEGRKGGKSGELRRYEFQVRAAITGDVARED